MKPALAVVPERTESLGARVRRLQAEAKSLAKNHVGELSEAIANVERLAAEIAAGGEAYSAGIRDIAARLAEDCDARIKSLSALMGRIG